MKHKTIMQATGDEDLKWDRGREKVKKTEYKSQCKKKKKPVQRELKEFVHWLDGKEVKYQNQSI